MKNKVKASFLCVMMLMLVFIDGFSQSIRKPWREMTSAERQDFVNALNALNGSVPQTLASEHIRLALLFNNNNQHIHNANIFLPWHRVFLYYLEEELKQIDPNIAIPYWDWTDDWSPSSQLFADANGGNTGLFGYNINGNVWENPSTNSKYVRNFQTSESQPTTNGLSSIINTSNFSTHRTILEGDPHNTGHRFVGGSMATLSSPSDPIFYLHHAMVDKLWDDWVKINWSGGTLPFNDDLDPQLDMLTFIGYQGSTNANNVVRVNPNDWIDSKDIKVWYAENNKVVLEDYTSSGTEEYRYLGEIEAKGNFLVPSSSTVEMVSGSKIVLKSSFKAKQGSEFRAYLDANSFNTRKGVIASGRENKDELLEASLEASKKINSDAETEVYGQLVNLNMHNIEFTLFPNPSSGSVNILSESNISKITLYDLYGKSVNIRSFVIKGNRVNIDMSNLPEGIYLLKGKLNNGHTISRKLILD